MSTKSDKSYESEQDIDDGAKNTPSIEIDSPGDHHSRDSRATSPASMIEAGVAALLVPGKEKRTSRSSSPTQLTRELNIRVSTQNTRLCMLQELTDQLVKDGQTFCEEEVDCLLTQIDNIFKEFTRQHASLEVSWPAACLPHQYFTEDIYRQVSMCHTKGRLVAAKLKSKLKVTATSAQSPASSSSSSQHSPTKLPSIQLPKFSGDYAAWPPFRDLFKSLVVDHPEASNINKLHHLKSCLSGEAAQLIASMPMVGESFSTAWETLNTRYENQRLLIQAQLDKIFGSSSRIQGNSVSINQLITTITDAINMLHAIGQSTENWDCVLVYHITQLLDRVTKERWENTLGSNTRYPTYDQLMTFLHSRARSLEWIETPSSRETNQRAVSKATQQQRRPASVAHAATTPNIASNPEQQSTHSSDRRPFECDCCSEKHFVTSCPKFLKLSPKEKMALVKRKDLCTNCFGRHYLLSNQLDSTISNSKTLLATALAKIITPTTSYPVRLLVDPGSELTFIADYLVTQLNIRRQHSKLEIIGIGGTLSTHTRGVVSVALQSTLNDSSITIHAHALNTLTTTLPTFHSYNQEWPHIKHLTLADPDFLTPRPIEIILGADSYGLIINQGLIKGSPDMPIAQHSIFGWLILGPIVGKCGKSSLALHCATPSTSDQELQQLLTKFWEIETVKGNDQPTLTPDEEECEKHFKETHTRDCTGRYVVRLPLKSSADSLGNSFHRAQHCLQSQLRRLKRDPEYNTLYRQFLREYETLGHMKRAPETHSTRFHLPHHGVLRPESTSTKLRVVFNGSSRTSSGQSLNDIMHTGAKLQKDVVDVLFWVRKYRYVFATDITKMFRQIKVHSNDWDLQSILWLDENNRITPYHLTTVTYGTKAAPFLAVRVLHQLIEDEGHRFPLAVPSLLHGRYVDDIYGGADTLQELRPIITQLQQLCMAGGFPLAKWQANNPQILDQLNESTEHSPIIFEDCNTKILGLTWHPHSDYFSFRTLLPPIHSKITKRLILSETAQIFDPLGFVSPIIIRAKVLLQELWLHKLGWDEQLPEEVTHKWLSIREELNSLSTLKIPRWINTLQSTRVTLHGFSDASQLAMAAVVYVVTHSRSGGTKISLLCSKTRVAPLSKLTIPRLELTAALLLAKLVTSAQRLIDSPIHSTNLWTDSSVALTWIQSHPSRWKDFVQNRVIEIQTLTPNAHWRFVKGKENSADLGSRGVSTTQLLESTLWWSGPPWLSKSQDSWPNLQPALNSASESESRKSVPLLAVIKPEYHWDLIYKYSTLSRLLRITAIIQRVHSRLTGIPQSTLESPINSMDLETAKLFWIRATQAAYFSHELRILSTKATLPPTHVFRRLTAYIDSHGVIRAGGRLENSLLDPEAKHPVILPKSSKFTTLVIDETHRKTMHGGTQLTLATLRQQFWILGGRSTIKSHIRQCVICTRHRGERARQLMGQLPRPRAQPAPPFFHTGVDYAGPITLKTLRGRGAKKLKAWICVFVCFATSAVHLEVVCDYSAESFIAAYRRFTARRGICHTLYSDCGTTFVGADTALKSLFTQATGQSQRLSTLLLDDGTNWTFNPPAAPHMGGKWEAVVKSLKYHMQRTTGDLLLTLEEATTLLAQIEAILNSRPLEPLTEDPDDISAITPGHFLIGKPLITLPEPSLTDLPTTRLNRWQLIQQRTQQFWNRWSTHYLQKQLALSKWYHSNQTLKVGTLVLLTDERTPPSKWPLARIIQLHPGEDNLTRVVTLKTATTTLKRPIHKLVILPVSSVNEETSTITNSVVDGGRNVRGNILPASDI